MDHERVSFNLARLRKGGETFEVAVDPDQAIAMKSGRQIDIHDVIRSEKIFADVKKGLLASEHHLQSLFATTDVLQIAKQIIMQGEIQLTAEHREKVREEKHRKIVALIARNAMDPKTKLPHPPQRIENAMEETRVKIDEYKTAEEQLDAIIKKLRTVLSISMETKKIWIKVPAENAAKAYNALVPFAKPQQEKWNNDGSLECHVGIPAGMEADLYERLNKVTKGACQTQVVE
ncbi:ribosome assembly factor SBDS [Candidatus Woesearchaeota archaeon]|nr:ribosome assembly factor SBDS [Candidatus Woesearchaeota archaeon]